MPAVRHLRNAPITEAVIDFKVKARESFQASEFSALKGVLANRFPNADERKGARASFHLGPSGVETLANEDLGLQGLIFSSGDGKLLAQFRTDGFTLNRLKPYTSWKELFPTALELWERYCTVASPEAVIRLAVRYINHIPLPAEVRDFSDYMRASPIIPTELPQYVSAFFTRVTIHDSQGGHAAHVVQALEVDSATRKATLILDIDAFHEAAWPPRDPVIKEVFDTLHDFKDLVFFNYLTEEALRRFE